MKILQIHNEYKNIGGEDMVVERERELLESHGHTVLKYSVNNNSINTSVKKILTVFQSIYSYRHCKSIAGHIKKFKPDLVHIHNTFPLISPEVINVCKKFDLPVVHSIHNFRIQCINGFLYRENKICEKCIHVKIPLAGLVNKCYRDSYVASLSPFMMNTYHNLKGTFEKIDKLIFLTDLSKEIFQKSFYPLREKQIAIKPNFVQDNGYALEKEDYYLFVGRLIPAKGIKTIITTFKHNNKRLKIAGTGPLEKEILENIKTSSTIEYLGQQNQDQLKTLYLKAKALIFSSEWYENMPLVILEAYSHGTPVIASNVGNGGSMVEEEVTGLKFQPGNADDLRKTIEKFEKKHDVQYNIAARKLYEDLYSPEKNITLLVDIYNELLCN